MAEWSTIEFMFCLPGYDVRPLPNHCLPPSLAQSVTEEKKQAWQNEADWPASDTLHVLQRSISKQDNSAPKALKTKQLCCLFQ